MKDFLKVLAIVAVAVIAYVIVSGGSGDGQLIDSGLVPYVVALIGTITLVAYFLMKLLRQKR